MSTIAVDNARPSLGGTSFSLTAGTMKALLNYDQSGPTINDSENISSVTDQALGNFQPIYTNAFSTAFYYVAHGNESATAGSVSGSTSIDAMAAANAEFFAEAHGGTANDWLNCLIYAGDLA